MFFIGQSASILPILLLAVTYFLGMLGYSYGLNQNQSQNSCATELTTHIVLKSEFNSQTNTSNSKSYQYASSTTISEKLSETKNYINPKVVSIQHLQYASNLECTPIYFSDIFLRPPPFSM